MLLTADGPLLQAAGTASATYSTGAFAILPSRADYLSPSSLYAADKDRCSGRPIHIFLEREDDIGGRTLDSVVRSYGKTDSLAASAAETLGNIKSIDQEFIASGKYDAMADYMRNTLNGPTRLRELQRNKSYSAMFGVQSIMYTFPTLASDTVIGTVPDLERQLHVAAHDAGLTRDEMLEYALTHEYFHNVQPPRILKKATELYEAHNDMQLAYYFGWLAGKMHGEESKSYAKMAQYACLRSASLLRSYVKLFGVPLSDAQLKELVENNSIERVISYLEHRKTRVPGKCEKGRYGAAAFKDIFDEMSEATEVSEQMQDPDSESEESDTGCEAEEGSSEESE